MKKTYMTPRVVCTVAMSNSTLLAGSVKINNGHGEPSQKPDDNPDDFEVGAKDFNAWSGWDE